MIGTRFEGIVQNVRDSALEFIDRQTRPHKYLLNQLRHRDFLGGGLLGFAVGHYFCSKFRKRCCKYASSRRARSRDFSIMRMKNRARAQTDIATAATTEPTEPSLAKM